MVVRWRIVYPVFSTDEEEGVFIDLPRGRSHGKRRGQIRTRHEVELLSKGNLDAQTINDLPVLDIFSEQPLRVASDESLVDPFSAALRSLALSNQRGRKKQERALENVTPISS